MAWPCLLFFLRSGVVELRCLTAADAEEVGEFSPALASSRTVEGNDDCDGVDFKRMSHCMVVNGFQDFATTAFSLERLSEGFF